MIGAFHETIELCQACNFEIIGIIDKSLRGEYLKIPILGTDSDAGKLVEYFENVPVIISPDKPEKRKRLSVAYRKTGFTFCNLIHPKCQISENIQFRNGIVIQSGVQVSPGVYLGDFVKINSRATIMHDCQIGNYTTIAPLANILGNVKIGESCYIGASAVILPGLTIGDNSIVGAGAIVTKDVKSTTVAGNPAKIIHHLNSIDIKR